MNNHNELYPQGTIGRGVLYGVLFVIAGVIAFIAGLALTSSSYGIPGGATALILAFISFFVILIRLNTKGKTKTATGFAIIASIPVLLVGLLLGSCIFRF